MERISLSKNQQQKKSFPIQRVVSYPGKIRMPGAKTLGYGLSVSGVSTKKSDE